MSMIDKLHFGLIRQLTDFMRVPYDFKKTIIYI